MNRTFRLVWSDIRRNYVVAPESARGGGKKSRSAMIATALIVLVVWSEAATSAELPVGGQVLAGSGSLVTDGSKLTVHQATPKLAIDWQSFNIGQGKTVEFVQPSASAVALNRVLGTDVSVIQGALRANGQVFIVNPNGVLFTPTAQVNVSGIVASTLHIKTDDFMAGKYRFEGASRNAIVNKGNITASPGGTIALIAAKISNLGQISAERGSVLMGAGSKVRLDLGGPVKIEVEEGTLDALIEQGGGVRADGGLVYLTAKALGQLTTTVINHTGITEAKTLATGEQGQIYLMGGMDKDRIVVGGTLDATAPAGIAGGFVETSAGKVQIAVGAQVQAGHWLIDPADITVDDSMASTLQGQLATGPATVQTTGSAAGNGDIFVESPITWSSGQTLTLSAHRNIQINAPLTANDSAGKLALKYGQGAVAAGNTAKYSFGTAGKANLQPGVNFSTVLGSNGGTSSFTVLASGTAPFTNGSLNGSSARWALGADVDFTAEGARSGGFVTSTAAGFILEGLGHRLSNISITPNANRQGFFGQNSGVIRNLSVENLNISGPAFNTSGFVAHNYQSSSEALLENIKILGTTNLSCTYDCAPLVGWNDGGTVRNFSVVGEVKFDSVPTEGGSVVAKHTKGMIANGESSATMTIANPSNQIIFGGIVGYSGHTISNVTFSGSITAASTRTGSTVPGVGIGGIAGTHQGGLDKIISSSVFSGTINAGNGAARVGGIAGDIYASVIQDSSSLGTIATGTNSSYVGGVVGAQSTSTAKMSNVAFRGNIAAGSGSTYVGGLAGLANNNVFDSSVSGAVVVGGAQVTLPRGASPNYIGKLFGNGGEAASTVYSQTPITVSAEALSVNYGTTPSYSLTLISGSLNGSDLKNILTGAPSCSGCVNVGTYSVTQGNVALSSSYSTEYFLTWQNGTLTINKANLMLTGTRAYDGGTKFAGQYLTATGVNGETFKVTGAGDVSNLASKHVADNQAVALSTVTGLGLGSSTNGGLSGNYNALSATGSVVSLTQAPLTVTGLSAQNKTYDGTATLIVSGTPTVTGFFSDDVSVTGTASGAFGNQNVGTSKAVTVSGLTLAGAAAGNYSIVQPTGLTADITKAPLTVSADHKSRVYGAVNPALTATIAGFVNGESLSTSGVTGAAALSTSATANTGVGTADIVAAIGTLAASNYDFNFTNGTLTITKAPLTVTADAQTKIRGTNDPALSFQLTSGTLVGNDTLVGKLSRTAGEERGKYEITRGSLSNSNYDINFISDFLTIMGPPPPTVGEASAVSIAQTLPTDAIKESGRPGLASTLPGLRVGQISDFASTQVPSAAGSLILVEQSSNVPQSNSAEASGGETSRSRSTVLNPSEAGRDALGFMRVGVVNGGVNIDLTNRGSN